MIERYGNTAEKLSVDTSFAENFVNIGAIAANLLSQPSRGAALTTQFIADKRTDVNLYATFFGSC